ncbi:MAG TPA: sn-glycerol-3-phosphate ABC transporter ATP-binding protein UgpC [Inquilinus sp.]|nr:sn-glycerol-3-phosphate ABC transporter ATP-binding protein UgpC [Inquilinus sp.]
MADVSLRRIVKTYGKTPVIHGLDLDIADGEFVVLVGPSGCGKSTTLRMIAGLEEIDGGEIRIGGRAVNTLEPKDRNIAMVFQNYAIYPHMTVRRNIGFGLRSARLPQAEKDRKVEEAGTLLGLTPYLDRRPSELSGGQRQRVAIGRAMVRDPAVFLFDEPLSNLDAQLRGQMRLEIKKLHQRLGSTIVFVTHDQVEAMTLADRIVVMRDGHILQVGSPAELYHRPANVFTARFIGSPPMNLLPGQVAVVDGRVAVALDGGGAAPLPAAAAGVAPGRRVLLGVRPDDLALAEDQAPADAFVIEGVVSVVEPLGPETLLHVDAAGAAVVGTAPGRRPPPVGRTVRLAAANDTLHLFDAESEQTLCQA